ncbi:MAG TPA: hypothetical protein VJR89_41925 [Polyangiales bacterium]|nr:hypothetical protein [Polyangiales bacterium]
MHDAPSCACALCDGGHVPALFPANRLPQVQCLPLTAAESALFSSTARWLDESISRPNPALGRSGDVCPWTRRTLQLGRLYLASIPATQDSCLDASLLALLREFSAMRETTCLFDTFRAIVAVFPNLPEGTADQIVVTTHARLKPLFLRERAMLGEFYPKCEKPGLHAPDFRPLRAPHPLLVIRAMVEADLWFLLDRDEFLDAYLDAFGARGRERVLELLESPDGRVAPDRLLALRQRMLSRPRS